MKKLITFILIAVVSASVVSCGFSETNVKAGTNDFISIQAQDGLVVELGGDIRYVPVEKESINTGTCSYMYTLVDLETGCSYLYIETGSNYRYIYSNLLTPLTNADGTPCIYEDLDELREFYGYNE